MLKHFHGQRQRSLRLLAAQIALSLAGGLIWFLASGAEHCLAFVSGVLVMSAGQLLQSLVCFSGGVQGPQVWFRRFLAAVLLKWILVFSLLAFCFDSLRDAQIALLAGVVASLFVIQLFNFYDVKVKRGS